MPSCLLLSPLSVRTCRGYLQRRGGGGGWISLGEGGGDVLEEMGGGGGGGGEPKVCVTKMAQTNRSVCKFHFHYEIWGPEGGVPLVRIPPFGGGGGGCCGGVLGGRGIIGWG